MSKYFFQIRIFSSFIAILFIPGTIYGWFLPLLNNIGGAASRSPALTRVRPRLYLLDYADRPAAWKKRKTSSFSQLFSGSKQRFYYFSDKLRQECQEQVRR